MATGTLSAALNLAAGLVMDRQAHFTHNEQQTTAEKPSREANLGETRLLGTPGVFFLMLVLTACGGGGVPSARPTSALSGTLAYVVSECRVNKTSGYLLHQVIQVRQGDHEPITVAYGRAARERDHSDFLHHG
jgi:hypothetical protein